MTDLFTGAGCKFTMLCLPGNGDFLDRREPGLRTQQAEINALTGFRGVAARLLPMTSDRFPTTSLPLGVSRSPDTTLPATFNVTSADAAIGNRFAEDMFAAGGHPSVIGVYAFVTVTRQPRADWGPIVAAVQAEAAADL